MKKEFTETNESGYIIGGFEVSNYIVEENPHIENSLLINDTTGLDLTDKMLDTTNNSWKADDRPLPSIKRNVNNNDLMDLFTDEEYEALLVSAKTESKAELFVKSIDNSDELDLEDVRFQSRLASLVALGVLTGLRMAEIRDSTGGNVRTYQPPRV